MVKFVCRCDGNAGCRCHHGDDLFFEAMRYQCFWTHATIATYVDDVFSMLWFFTSFYWFHEFPKNFKGIFMVFHGFWLVFKVFHFLKFTIVNHRSSDAMFAMYHSSLMSRFLCEDFVQHSYHIITDYEEGRRSIIEAAHGPRKVCLTL